MTMPTKHPSSRLDLLVLVAGLALFAWTQYGDTLNHPLVTDDYFFLDKTRDAPFRVVWEPKNLVPAYYRPWAREFHYWTLQRVVGDSGAAFRVVNWILWFGVMAGYFALVRRLAGRSAGWVATAALAALGGWGVLLVWPAGAQDLWMLLFALLFLNAFVRSRTGWATAALTLALFSKETAAVLPLVAVAWCWLGERAPWRDTLRRSWPAFAIVAAWALVHPLLGGRWWIHTDGVAPFPTMTSPLGSAVTAVLSVANLGVAPAPEAGWAAPLTRGILGAAILAGLLLVAERWVTRSPVAKPNAMAAERRRTPRTLSPGAHIARFGIAWALIAWTPLLVPGLGWQAYYGLLAAMGIWLALSVFLARQPMAAAGIVATLALVRALQAATFSPEWGSEWFQRRAARLTDVLKRDLLARHPAFPPGSRLHLADLPGGVALVADRGNSPTLRIWYRDPTLWVGFFSHYQVRSLADTVGSDHFLVARPDGRGWYELTVGPEDVEVAQRENPQWAEYHNHLAGVLYRAGDVSQAYAENSKLATAVPDRPDFALNAAVCARDLGDSLAARQWYVLAAERQEAAKRAAAAAPPTP
jgi:hypothetical protein